MEDLPGWVISPMPGPLPRQHKHERQYTPSTHSIIPTRRIWNDDYDGQMVIGGLKFPDICLTGEEKPRKKTSPRKPVPTRDRTRARCVTSSHATTCSTAVDSPNIIKNLKSRQLRWAGHVALMEQSRNAYRVLVGKPEGKRLLGRPRRRWEDNIK